MYNDYEKMHSEIEKKYELELRQLEMLERIEQQFEEKRKSKEKDFLIRTELRVWNEVSDFSRTLGFIADHYGYNLYQFKKHDSDIYFYFRQRYNF